jgi:phospholipase C
MGAVFHVYDKLRLERIPRRYTVEAGKSLQDAWDAGAEQGHGYDLWVYGPNGFLREFRGTLPATGVRKTPEIEIYYGRDESYIRMIARNDGAKVVRLAIRANAYRAGGPWDFSVASHRRITQDWPVTASHNWYDFTVSGDEFERRFAGRMETGTPSFSDPSLAT